MIDMFATDVEHAGGRKQVIQVPQTLPRTCGFGPLEYTSAHATNEPLSLWHQTPFFRVYLVALIEVPSAVVHEDWLVGLTSCCQSAPRVPEGSCARVGVGRPLEVAKGVCV